MEFSIRALAPQGAKTGCLVLGVHQGSDAGAPVLSRAAAAADRAARGRLSSVLAHGDLSAKAGTTLLLHGVAGLAAERVLLVGLGQQKEFAESAFRKAVHGAAVALRELGARDAVAYFADLKVGRHPAAWSVRHAALALRDAFYRFDQLKTQNKAPALVLAQVTLATQGEAVTEPMREALREAAATADGVALARTLGNLPPNICTPTYLADEAKKLARQFKLGLEVLERRDMERLGMGALLAVTRGSHQPPKLIVLRYLGGAKKAPPLVLVGKGVTFDTGGISLKPAGEMDEMKYDMSGAGSVLGALRALAGMKAPVNVVGIVPACENMPGGQATRPGDVVKTMSGQTVEILNTDAEGRLILCDALTYAERFKPDAVIDIATLTGACVIALGHVATGLFANDDKLAAGLRAAGEDAWDRVWPMPLWEDYQEQLRSNFADMANIGGRPAGSVTAACYLARYTRKLRWAHLDIAGTAWKSGRDKGSTGRPVPLLVRFALARGKMTSVDFYFNAADKLQVACRLAGKALAQGKRLLIYAPQADTAQSIDRLLWTWPATGFVPHCRAGEALAAETPVLVATAGDAAPDCDILLNLGRETPPAFERYERLLEVVARDDGDRLAARERYRFYRERGYRVANHDLAGASHGE